MNKMLLSEFREISSDEFKTSYLAPLNRVIKKSDLNEYCYQRDKLILLRGYVYGRYPNIFNEEMAIQSSVSIVKSWINTTIWRGVMCYVSFI